MYVVSAFLKKIGGEIGEVGAQSVGQAGFVVLRVSDRVDEDVPDDGKVLFGVGVGGVRPAAAAGGGDE